LKKKNKTSDDVLGISMKFLSLIIPIQNVKDSIVNMFNCFIDSCDMPPLFNLVTANHVYSRFFSGALSSGVIFQYLVLHNGVPNSQVTLSGGVIFLVNVLLWGWVMTTILSRSWYPSTNAS
jgi:hypothetical protein